MSRLSEPWREGEHLDAFVALGLMFIVAVLTIALASALGEPEHEAAPELHTAVEP